jgi:signal transduction histidine kinase
MVTVDWAAAEQADEGTLACSPDVARWLHDEVVQRLSSVVAVLASNGRLRQRDQARCRVELEATLGALRVLLEDRLAQPPARRFRTVAEAVRAASATSGGRALELRIRGDAEVSATTGQLVADFVAETLRNVGKHAQARSVVLTVTVDDEAVNVDAFNDGVARESNGLGAGIGLRLLAARALDHCGFVSTGAASPDGWSTTLTLARRPDACAGGFRPPTRATP